jgi:hypothetical protein
MDAPPREERAKSMGINATVEYWFKRHPVAFPSALSFVGVVLSFLCFQAHLFIGFAFSGIFGVSGLIALPFGITVALRRKANPVTLRCPKCGMTSAIAPRPFAVERFPDVEYAVVTCPGCAHFFTVDGHAPLK